MLLFREPFSILGKSQRTDVGRASRIPVGWRRERVYKRDNIVSSGICRGQTECTGLLQANVLPRDILYTHTFRSPRYFRFRNDASAGIASCAPFPPRRVRSGDRFPLPSFIAICFQSRELRERTPRDVSSALYSRAVDCTDGAFTLHFIMVLEREWIWILLDMISVRNVNI